MAVIWGHFHRETHTFGDLLCKFKGDPSSFFPSWKTWRWVNKIWPRSQYSRYRQEGGGGSLGKKSRLSRSTTCSHMAGSPVSLPAAFGRSDSFTPLTNRGLSTNVPNRRRSSKIKEVEGTVPSFPGFHIQDGGPKPAVHENVLFEMWSPRLSQRFGFRAPGWGLGICMLHATRLWVMLIWEAMGWGEPTDPTWTNWLCKCGAKAQAWRLLTPGKKNAPEI